MHNSPPAPGETVRNFPLTCTATRKTIRERAVHLAHANGRAAVEVSKSDWEQARRDLAANSGMNSQEMALASAPESSRWDPLPGSLGTRAPVAPGDDEDAEGRSQQEQMTEAGVARAESDLYRAAEHGPTTAVESPVTDERIARILARLETGFRTDSNRLRDLDREFTETLQSARHFGNRANAVDRWNVKWYQEWDQVEFILRQTKMLVIEMEQSIATAELTQLQAALAASKAIQAQNHSLAQALAAIRAQANQLTAADRADWNILARTLKSHVETIHSCAQALRIKLELLQDHSHEEVNELVQATVSV